MKYRVVFFIAWLCVAAVAAPAKDKGPSADDVLKKGLDSTDVWSHGPLMITAKVRFLQMRSGPMDMDYVLYWEAPDRWRSEWRGAGILDVHAANGAQTWAKSNLRVPSLRVLEFNGAMHALTDGFLPSPFGMSAPPKEEPQYKVRSRNINGVPSYCLQLRSEELMTCFSVENGTPVRNTFDLGVALYSDYVEFEDRRFPSSIRIRERKNGDTVVEAKLEIHLWKLDATLWQAPTGTAVSGLPRCTDKRAPALGGKAIRLQQPQYPFIARESRQQGTVILYATIGVDGHIKNLVTLQSAGPNLDQAAYQAVERWTYEPSFRCGVPIEVDFPISINFSLSP